MQKSPRRPSLESNRRPPFREIRGRGLSFLALVLAAAVAGSPARAQTVAVGSGPVAVAYDSVTNKLYVLNSNSNNVTVIDGATQATATVAVGEFPSALAVNAVTNKIYVANLDSADVTVIDGATNAVVTVPAGAGATAVAVNPATNKIYVANSFAGSVTVIDGATNATATVGGGPGPAGLAVNAVTNKIYVADDQARTVTVIDGMTNATTTVNAASGSTALAVDQVTNKIYVLSNPVTVIDGATNATTTVAVQAFPEAIGINPVTGTVYIANVSTGSDVTTATSTVSVINEATNASTTIPVGIWPFAIAVDSATDTIYVANKSGNNVTEINGATGATATVAAGADPDAIAVNPATNQFGVANFQGGTVGVAAGAAGTPVAPPAITASPQSQSVGAGQSATFTGAATGSPAYQWLFNGVAIAGATNASLTVNNVSAVSAGTYALVATNGGGSVVATATLAVAAPSLSAFTIQPLPQSVVGGTTVVFNVAASGSPAPAFQWKLNGSNVSGATSARLVIASAAAANAGSYTCVATNSQGSATSTAAALAFVTTTNVGRLINLSVNTTAGKSQVLTVGFVSGGSGTTGTENLLIRATGPALAAFGVPNTLVDPTLSVLNGSTVIVSNDNWGSTSTNQSAVTAADNATGAFALANPTSLDAGVAMPFSAGADTVQVSGNTANAGTALAEVYDNTASYTLATPRLINLSAKNQLAAAGSMTAGFVVGGTTAKTVLIRVTGPALAVLGVPGTMPDPQLALHTTLANGQDSVLATNAGWGGDPQITTVSNSIGAFTLTSPTSADSVLLMTLPPGGYTAVASSVSGAAGTVLIEVYEVP